jgi:hypothetical protein
MPEIGPTLREARMRARIDISEIETTTKIRAKYLRALENEEWDLLPGPTYVKTFLRTYAEALGLDAKLIVEEYKLRHERPSDAELRPIAPPRSGRRAGSGAKSMRSGSFGSRQRRGVPRGYIVGGIVVLLLGVLAYLGRDDEPAVTPTTTAEPATPGGGAAGEAGAEGGTERERERPRERASSRRRSRTVRLQIIPRGEVYVCLVDRSGRVLVNGATLRPGDRTDTFRSRRFRLALGNNNVILRLNGRNRSVPASDQPIFYDITRKQGRRPLPARSRPDCAA